MPNIRAVTQIDENQSAQKHCFLTCPKCKQKLADVVHLRGVSMMRFKCRRCGTYVTTDILGTT